VGGGLRVSEQDERIRLALALVDTVQDGVKTGTSPSNQKIAIVTLCTGIRLILTVSLEGDELEKALTGVIDMMQAMQ
jgi:hypothetical protein